MTTQPYSYDRKDATRYTFISKGKHGVIIKAVEFIPTSNKFILNLGFGDLKPDGTIDDTANSNNGDIIKVMATIIHIVKDFADELSGLQNCFHRKHNTKNQTLSKDFKNLLQ